MARITFIASCPTCHEGKVIITPKIVEEGKENTLDEIPQTYYCEHCTTMFPEVRILWRKL